MPDLYVTVKFKEKGKPPTGLYYGIAILDRRSAKGHWFTRYVRYYPTESAAQRSRAMVQQRARVDGIETVAVTVEWMFARGSNVTRNLYPPSYMAKVIRVYTPSLAAKCRRASLEVGPQVPATA